MKRTRALNVCNATCVVPDGKIRNVVVQRVDGKIATPDILVDRPINIVTQNAAAISVRAIISVAATRCTESGYLNNIAAEAYVCEPESAADKPRISK